MMDFRMIYDNLCSVFSLITKTTTFVTTMYWSVVLIIQPSLDNSNLKGNFKLIRLRYFSSYTSQMGII